MPDRRRELPDYDRNVFINCPFDDIYEPVFRAVVFVVFECGLSPRCAKEAYDSGEVRIEKIVGSSAIVGGVFTTSREPSPTRMDCRDFNMPLELGLFLGARRFGAGQQRRKSCLRSSTATRTATRSSSAISRGRTSRRTARSPIMPSGRCGTGWRRECRHRASARSNQHRRPFCRIPAGSARHLPGELSPQRRTDVRGIRRHRLNLAETRVCFRPSRRWLRRQRRRNS